MIKLDQVLLLQEKVEAAVEKISSLTDKVSQLEFENDALRSKCAELTKAFSEKTELVSTIESTQAKIEESILKTLNRLDSVEDAILSGQGVQTGNENSSESQPVQNEIPQEGNTDSEQQASEQTVVSEPQIFQQEEPKQMQENPAEPQTDLNGQFDIF